MSHNAATPKIQPGDFEFLSELLRKHSGLALAPDKEYLLESRLLPIARSRSMRDIAMLVAALKASPSGELLTEIIEAMTTNESFFFRDNKPFEYLRHKLLPMLREQAKGRKSLRIWSAAASTGQEPYSVAMTLMEDAASDNWQYEIIGTDIAQKVLNKAAKGIFSQFEVQRGLPILLLMKYFKQQPDTTWQIREQIRSMVHLRKHNLLDSFSGLGKFDLVLCRNVLIYFSDTTKKDIVRRICDTLQPGGVLMLGSSESLLDTTLPLNPIEGMPGTYQLK